MPKYPKILGSKSSVSSSVSGTFLLCCESGGSLTMMATDCRRGLPPDDDGNPYGNRPLFRTNWKKYAFGTEIGLFSVRRLIKRK